MVAFSMVAMSLFSRSRVVLTGTDLRAAEDFRTWAVDWGEVAAVYDHGFSLWVELKNDELLRLDVVGRPRRAPAYKFVDRHRRALGDAIVEFGRDRGFQIENHVHDGEDLIWRIIGERPRLAKPRRPEDRWWL